MDRRIDAWRRFNERRGMDRHLFALITREPGPWPADRPSGYPTM